MPPAYPADWIETLTLRDGSQAVLRPIRPDDAPGLQAGFNRLTPQTIYLRFLETFKQLTDQQARDFSNVDYSNRMAFVAEIEEAGGHRALIGVARYAMIRPEEKLAEAAIVVVDEYQNRGLGTLMLDRLVDYARAHGVQGFLATVHLSNAQIMRFIKRSGFATRRKLIEPGVWEITILMEKGPEVENGNS